MRISRALLERVQQVYEDAITTLNESGRTSAEDREMASLLALPERQIRIGGDGVYDCEQLIVSLASLAEGTTQNAEAPPNPCHIPVTATFHIVVVRCVPVPNERGDIPSPEQLARATDVLLADSYLLMKAACQFDMFGEDVVGLPDGAKGGMGVDVSLEVQTAEGGMQAVDLTLTTVIG